MAVEDFWIATTVESVLDPSCIGVDEVAHRTTDSARPGWLARGRAAACSRGCWIGNRAVVRRLCGHRVRLAGPLRQVVHLGSRDHVWGDLAKHLSKELVCASRAA